jgi:hypothetical protein
VQRGNSFIIKPLNLNKMKKVVLNNCYGGFGLSDKALELIAKRKNTTDRINHWGLKRDDEDLIAVVEELGTEAEGHCAELIILEFDEGVEYDISEYDGSESIEYYVPVTMEELVRGLSMMKLDLAGKYNNLKLVD